MVISIASKITGMVSTHPKRQVAVAFLATRRLLTRTFLLSTRAARHHAGGLARAAGCITIAPPRNLKQWRLVEVGWYHLKNR